MCAYYLFLGMTTEEYWNGELWLTAIYREAHEYRREMRNQELYLQGRYIYDGFAAVMAQFAAGLSKKGGGRNNLPKYPEQPYPLTEREQYEDKIRRIKHTREWLNTTKELYARKDEAKNG